LWGSLVSADRRRRIASKEITAVVCFHNRKRPINIGPSEFGLKQNGGERLGRGDLNREIRENECRNKDFHRLNRLTSIKHNFSVERSTFKSGNAPLPPRSRTLCWNPDLKVE